ncbi:hypothetical protein D3C80_953970 [compost metagenome]
MRHAIKHEGLFRFGDVKHVIDRRAVSLQGNHVALCIVQFNIQRDVQRQFFRLIGGRRGFLADVQTVLVVLGVVFVTNRQ